MRLLRFWYIPVFAIVVIAGWVLWNRWTQTPTIPPIERIKREMEALDESAQVKRMKAELGKKEALRYVLKKYRADIQAMDEARAARVAKFAEDPEALTRFIVRGRV